MKTYVVITARFSALHFWYNCPIKEVKYLQHLHRHVFHITMKFPVKHNDRDIEFIQMKNKVENYLYTNYEKQNLQNTSCEMIAENLINKFNACYCSVFEDGENGAEVYNE